ncbi:hypothetical protein J6590_029431 [Homalodisca vitripennis]|nr:hypothetical protein J6590_029431 [Homalodisca vitripennis]
MEVQHGPSVIPAQPLDHCRWSSSHPRPDFTGDQGRQWPQYGSIDSSEFPVIECRTSTLRRAVPLRGTFPEVTRSRVGQWPGGDPPYGGTYNHGHLYWRWDITQSYRTLDTSGALSRGPGQLIDDVTDLTLLPLPPHSQSVP